jgi:general secretion pathway protein F
VTHFHYQAVELSGHAVTGVIEATDRKTALQLLGEKGLFPSHLEVQSAAAATNQETVSAPATATRFRLGPRIKRKEITALTRELATLLRATIPIPQALDSLSEEEENPALKKLIHEIAESVRLGASLSGALSEHPKLFSKLYVSMVRVGEESRRLARARGRSARRGCLGRGVSVLRARVRHFHSDRPAHVRAAAVVRHVAGDARHPAAADARAARHE